MKNNKKLLGAIVVLALVASAGFIFANGEDLQGRFGRGNSLSITLASSPVSGTYIKGEEDVQFVGVNFECVGSLDCVLSDVTFQGYLDDDGNASLFGTSMARTTHRTQLSDYVSNLHFEDSSGTTFGSSESVGSTFKVNLTGVDYNISAGDTETLYLIGDLSSRAFANSNAENIAFGIPNKTMIVGEYSDGNSLTAVGKVNNSQTVYITTAESGTLSLSASSDTESDQNVNVNTEFLLGSFTLSSVSESFDISRLKLRLNDTNAADSISYVTLKYPTDPSDPTTLDGSTRTTLSGDTLSYNLSSFLIAADESTEFEVWVYTTSAATADVGDQIKFDITAVADSIRAVGEASGKTLVGTDVLSTTVSTNTATVN